jgi:glycosyltransferase involved in cell wall biosynthesis
MPIIASRTGGLVEAVDEGFSGLLVPNEKKAVAAALAALRDDRNLSLRFSENARRRYLSKFTLDNMVERTLDAYREFENE